jgi:hypothetical protein
MDLRNQAVRRLALAAMFVFQLLRNLRDVCRNRGVPHRFLSPFRHDKLHVSYVIT